MGSHEIKPYSLVLNAMFHAMVDMTSKSPLSFAKERYKGVKFRIFSNSQIYTV